jgi:hypothetical protein
MLDTVGAASQVQEEVILQEIVNVFVMKDLALLLLEQDYLIFVLSREEGRQTIAATLIQLILIVIGLNIGQLIVTTVVVQNLNTMVLMVEPQESLDGLKRNQELLQSPNGEVSY